MKKKTFFLHAKDKKIQKQWCICNVFTSVKYTQKRQVKIFCFPSCAKRDITPIDGNQPTDRLKSMTDGRIDIQEATQSHFLQTLHQ